MNPAITTSEIWRYSLLALPLAFAGLPIYLLAPDFYVISFGASLTQIGFVLLILRFADALIDPLIGWTMDRKKSHFRFFMHLGAGLLGLGLVLLFWVPNLSQNLTILWFSSAVFITTLAYSILAIGYGTQGAAWSSEHREQVRITSSRETLTLVGLVFSISLPFLLLAFLETVTAYRALSVLLLITLFFCFSLYKGVKSQNKGHAINNDQLSVNSVQMAIFYGTYGLSALASAIPAVLVIFFVRDYLGRYEMTPLFLVIYFLAGISSMTMWRRLSNRWGKLKIWQASMLLAIAGFCLVLLIQPMAATQSSSQLWLYALVCLITGLALGAELCIPPAMLSELTQENTNNLGLKYAGLTSLNKICLALAAGLSLPILGTSGFMPDAVNRDTALLALLWLYGGLPCFLKFVAFIFSFTLNRYTEKNHVTA